MRDYENAHDFVCRYSTADWKHNCLIGNEPSLSPPHASASVKLFENAANYIYEQTMESGELEQEVVHLIYLATAEALLDPSITSVLRGYQIDAPFVEDSFLPHRCFEYVVTDPDESIAANYCEIVIANRITNRMKLLLG
jgi:hypothetical protein